MGDAAKLTYGAVTAAAWWIHRVWTTLWTVRGCGGLGHSCERFSGRGKGCASRGGTATVFLAEDCVLENTAPAPDGERYEGRKACLNFWRQIVSSANLVFKAEEIWASGDRGFIRWHLRWGEREADRVRGVNLMRVRDGKIVEGLGYVKG